jgi:hypothetical protein
MGSVRRLGPGDPGNRATATSALRMTIPPLNKRMWRYDWGGSGKRGQVTQHCFRTLLFKVRRCAAACLPAIKTDPGGSIIQLAFMPPRRRARRVVALSRCRALSYMRACVECRAPPPRCRRVHSHLPLTTIIRAVRRQ